MSKGPVISKHLFIIATLCLGMGAAGCGSDDADDAGAGTEAATEPTTTTTGETATTVESTVTTQEETSVTQGDPTSDTDEDPTASATEGETEAETEAEEDTDSGDCTAHGDADDCNADDACEWFGSPQHGFCGTEGGGGIELCEQLGMQQCNAAPNCTWSQQESSCTTVSCDELGQTLCALAPGCTWDAGNEACMDG